MQNTTTEHDNIIYKRFTENKSYRQIGIEIDKSRTYVMKEINKHYENHPELIKPVPKEKAEPKTPVRKKGIKSHTITEENKEGIVADILVNGYAARLVTRYTNCGSPSCGFCKRDSEGKYKGHGPYTYLAYRDESGNVRTKYLSIEKLAEITSKKLISTWDIPIVLKEEKE